MNRHFPLLIAASALGLMSCTSLKTAVNKATTPVKTAVSKTNTSAEKTSQPRQSTFARLKSKGFTLPNFLRKTPPVVEVKNPSATKVIAKTATQKKPASKKPKPSKADLLAWKRKKAAEKEKALVPKDFAPSDLDVDGQLPSYGILPSLRPGASTAIEDIDDAAILPADVANLPSIPSLSSPPSIPDIPAPKTAPDLSTVPDYLKPAGPVPAIKTGE